MGGKKIIFKNGQQFGYLTVLSSERTGRDVLCRCVCGNETHVNASGVLRGLLKSCGCKRYEKTSADGEQHAPSIRKALGLDPGVNLCKHRTYRIWKSMRQRCMNKNHHASARYAGKGVSICEEWSSFLIFLSDMGHPPSDQHSIDRINTNGNYEPENCRWATKQEQSDNRTSNIYFETEEGRKTLSAKAAQHGLKMGTVWQRRKNGWPEADWFIPKTNRWNRSTKNA